MKDFFFQFIIILAIVFIVAVGLDIYFNPTQKELQIELKQQINDSLIDLKNN